MSSRHQPTQLPCLTRRNFLRGAAGVTLALPFLEGMPERSAWAADAPPVFSLFICGVGGVVPPHFFPSARGPLTSLGGGGKATDALAAHAKNLLFVSGIRRLPFTNDSHLDFLVHALTARPNSPAGHNVGVALGPSADTFIASRVHPGLGPLALYAGFVGGFEDYNLSFLESGARTPIISNPYVLYRELIGLTGSTGGSTPSTDQTARLLLESRQSVHDLVREELVALLKNRRLSAADRERLQLHLDSVRDVEVAMGGMGNTAVEQCSSEGLDIDQLEALKTVVWDKHESTDAFAKLHMSLVALAFACNYRRTASLQWGEPYDSTIYRVPSNSREWKFDFIQHRAQSDSATGDDVEAEQAHIEIDALRMKHLADGLEHFAARGLQDRSFVLWTNNFADGWLHSSDNVPHIIWGNAAGYLKQGQYVDAGDVGHNRLLNTLITAAIQDTGAVVEDFGEGTGGQLDILRA